MPAEDLVTVRVTRAPEGTDSFADRANETNETDRRTFNRTVGDTSIRAARMTGAEWVNPAADIRSQPSASLTLVVAVAGEPFSSMTEIVAFSGARPNP